MQMTEIKPFKAVIFNQEKIKDLSKVVCPPYDVISAQKQEYYHAIEPYNFIHILLGKDIPGEDKYQRAGKYFKDWLKAKVFTQDSAPAIYFYTQQYKVKGETKTRLGFISLLHLDDKNPNVFKHEHTRLEAKEDRFCLIKEVKANLSPIFSVFQDKKRIIQRVYQQHVQQMIPFIDVTDDEGTNHKLWRLDSPDVVKFMEEGMSQENIFIADGHHRYEVACAYRDLMKQNLGSITGKEDFNYILSYFTNTDPRGLSIFPIHRLVKLSSGFNFDSFVSAVSEYFDVEEAKDRIQFFQYLEKAGLAEHVIGAYKDKRYWLLRLKNVKILDKEISDKSKAYRMLDVSILNHLVFKKVLNLNVEDKKDLTFSPHAEEFMQKIDEDDSYIGFFLNPVKMEQIIEVALGGERMPAKSTYFYPKVLSGLVINKLS
ncbi:MAG: DUF1015 domain-containing protein [Candidatus Omnitrophica bacterium]|nr:DUF1015 domain-containing protein [Candidatus Omnitrophota bacterium]MBU1869574.1 DUF1015 domain-containing protein [Candidatus Omnitrophota bacterium]